MLCKEVFLTSTVIAIVLISAFVMPGNSLRSITLQRAGPPVCATAVLHSLINTDCQSRGGLLHALAAVSIFALLQGSRQFMQRYQPDAPQVRTAAAAHLRLGLGGLHDLDSERPPDL